MRSVSFIVALLFCLVGFSTAFPNLNILEARKDGKNGTSPKGNGTKANGVNMQCRTIAKLTKLTALANNQTKIDALVSKGKLKENEVAELKSKATEATPKLQALTANQTLVGECAVINAHRKTIGQCKQMTRLTKLAALANNQTALDDKISKNKLDDAQSMKFKDKVSKAQGQLDMLKSNTTLAGICSKEASQKGASGAGSTTQAGATSPERTSGAESLTLQSMPYFLVPAVGAVFTLFL